MTNKIKHILKTHMPNSIFIEYLKIFRKAYWELKKITRQLNKKNIHNNLYTTDKLKDMSPQVVLYLSGTHESAYQGNMWLKVLEKIDANVIIVLRNHNIIYSLNSTTLPVVILENVHQLELLEEAGVKTILYPSNPMTVTQSLRLYRLNHYFINHGESDKVVNQSKLLMAYDKLLVAGPMAKRRLIEAKLPIRDNQVIYVGRPQVELFLTKIELPSKEVKTILYAPTWEGFMEAANYSSINEYGIRLMTVLGEISKYKEVYVKLHPFTGNTNRGNIQKDTLKIEDIAKNTNINLVARNESIYKYMNMSDIMITDISSIISDYLYTGKPMVLTNARAMNHIQIHNDYPSTQGLYILDNPIKLDLLLSDIEERDTLLEERSNIANDILGHIPEGSINKFNLVINESLV